MSKLLSTHEASEYSNGKLSAKEFARLARRKKLAGATKAKGKWQLPESSVKNYLSKINIRKNKAQQILEWWERTSRVPILAIIILITVLLVNALDFFLNINSLFDLIAPGFSLYINKAGEDELLVLVTEFSGTGGYDPTTRIYRSLDEAIKASNLTELEDIKITVRRIPNKPNISEEAQRIGTRYKAAIVVWGTFDEAAIEPSIEVIKEFKWTQSATELGKIINTDQASYNFYIAEQLQSELEFVIFVILAKSFVISSNYPEAIKILNSALTIDLKDRADELNLGSAYAIRGEAYWLNEETKPAEIDLQQAIDLKIKDASVYHQLATIKALKGDYQDALKIIEEGLLLNEGSWLLYYTQGNSYYEMHQYDDALIAFTQSLDNLHECIGELCEEFEAVIYSNRGTTYSALEQIQNARNDYIASEKLFPDNPDLYHNWGDLEINDGNPEDALQYLNLSLSLGSEDIRTTQLRGVAYRNLGEYEKARIDFEYVINNAPKYGGGYYELGVLEMLEGNPEEARQNLEKTLEIWPDNILTMHWLLKIYKDSGDWEEIDKTLTRIIDGSDQDISELKAFRGLNRLNQLEFENAKSDFLDVLTTNPENHYALYGLGSIYILPEKRFADAIRIFNELEEINPEVSDLFLMRGLAYYLSGDIQKAISDCEQFETLKDAGEFIISSASGCRVLNNERIKGYAITYNDGLTTIYTP